MPHRRISCAFGRAPGRQGRRGLALGRRSVLALAGAALLGTDPALAAPSAETAARLRLADLARTSGGRLGFFVKAADGRILASAPMERFPMCSTFKALAVGALLSRIDEGRDHLDRVIAYGPSDLLDHAPTTRARLGQGGMTLGALAEAAIELSDNTAANLILAEIGGPEGLTAWLRSIGDTQTRLDRPEPMLNSAIPGDRRDTTTPRAMAESLEKLMLGSRLTPSSRERLTGWMLNCQTGANAIRAGVEAGWRVADKTGSGAHGTRNDVGVIWPPQGKPIVIALYLTGASVGDAERDQVIARATRILVDHAVGAPRG